MFIDLFQSMSLKGYSMIYLVIDFVVYLFIHFIYSFIYLCIDLFMYLFIYLPASNGICKANIKQFGGGGPTPLPVLLCCYYWDGLLPSWFMLCPQSLYSHTGSCHPLPELPPTPSASGFLFGQGLCCCYFGQWCVVVVMVLWPMVMLLLVWPRVMLLLGCGLCWLAAMSSSLVL